MNGGLREVGHHLRADVLPAVGSGFLIVFGSNRAAANRATTADVRSLDVLAYVLLALMVAGILLRRRAPLTMLGVESVLVGTYLIAGYPHGPSAFGLCVAAYAVGLRYPRREVSLFVGIAAVLFGAASVIGGDRILEQWNGLLLDALSVALMMMFLIVPAIIGHLVRRARIYADRASAEVTRRKLEEERLRVAREVHDVVGHSLSIISLQAGVALHVLDRRPEQAQLSLEAIRRTSIDALEELRATLALTRAGATGAEAPPATGTETPPQPPSTAGLGRAAAGAGRVPLTGLARLDGLLAEVRLCNVPVELTVAGAARPLPPEVDLAAYRIVQESVTNALRHAGAAQLHVALDYGPRRLTIDVVDRPRNTTADPTADPTVDPTVDPTAHGTDGAPVDTAPRPPATSPGHGLAGLSSRVAELRGSFSAGPVPAGGWHVHAELPVPAAEPPDAPAANVPAVANVAAVPAVPAVAAIPAVPAVTSGTIPG